MRSQDIAMRKNELEANPSKRLLFPLDELSISKIKELIPLAAPYVGGYSFNLRTYNDYGPSIVNTIENCHPGAKCLFDLRMDNPKNYSHLLQNLIKRPSIRYVTVNSSFFLKNNLSVSGIANGIDLLGTVEYHPDGYKRIADARQLFSLGFNAFVAKNKNELNLIRSIIPNAFVIAQRVGRIQDKAIMVRKPDLDLDTELRSGYDLLADIFDIHPAYTRLRTDYLIQVLEIFNHYMAMGQMANNQQQWYKEAV